MSFKIMPNDSLKNRIPPTPPPIRPKDNPGLPPGPPHIPESGGDNPSVNPKPGPNPPPFPDVVSTPGTDSSFPNPGPFFPPPAGEENPTPKLPTPQPPALPMSGPPILPTPPNPPLPPAPGPPPPPPPTTPPVPPPGQQGGSIPPPPPVAVEELKFRQDYSCFFMFGVKGSGKSTILSSLFYYIHTTLLESGHSVLLKNEKDIENQYRGQILLDKMLYEFMHEGKFPNSTPTLVGERSSLPRQINLEFIPQTNLRKPPFKFTMLDVSGEDLERIRPSEEDGPKSVLPGIEVFLKLPPQNLAFICVYPAHQDDRNHGQLMSYLSAFLNALDSRGFRDCPVIMIVSKWDRVQDTYGNDVSRFLKEKARILYSNLSQGTRNVHIMSFSIGKVQQDAGGTFIYDSADAEKLFNWMYEMQLNESLYTRPSEGIFSIFNTKKKTR